MKVNGIEIAPDHIAAGLAAMDGVFTFASVRGAMIRAGAGDEAFRAADRLLQQERKAGRITASGVNWKRVV